MLRLQNGYCYQKVDIESLADLSTADEHFIRHLDDAYNSGDKLAKNYNIKAITRMREYGYVYNKDPTDLVFMVGLEDFQNNIFRVESRLYVHPNYRKKYWTSPEGYYDIIKHQINNNINDCDFLFKSREAKNPAGFKISTRLTDYFNNWKIYPTQIELRTKNNIQWIMYRTLKGKTNEHIEKILYTV